MDIYAKLIQAIIEEQEHLIGPNALDEAAEVRGIKIDEDDRVSVVGDSKKVLVSLVGKYEKMFGRASVETCKDAIRPLIEKENNVDLPPILR